MTLPTPWCTHPRTACVYYDDCTHETCQDCGAERTVFVAETTRSLRELMEMAEQRGVAAQSQRTHFYQFPHERTAGGLVWPANSGLSLCGHGDTGTQVRANVTCEDCRAILEPSRLPGETLGDAVLRPRVHDPIEGPGWLSRRDGKS